MITLYCDRARKKQSQASEPTARGNTDFMLGYEDFLGWTSRLEGLLMSLVLPDPQVRRSAQ